MHLTHCPLSQMYTHVVYACMKWCTRHIGKPTISGVMIKVVESLKSISILGYRIRIMYMYM